MSFLAPAQTITTEGSQVVLRRVHGAFAREIFLHCQPDASAPGGAAEQAERCYRAILASLAAEGAGPAAIVSETIFLRALRDDLEPVRAARGRILSEGNAASTIVEQPPLAEHARLEVALHAIVAREREVSVASLPAGSPCGDTGVVQVQRGGERRLYAGALYGAGGDAQTQTTALFEAAESVLAQADMGFGDVVRTWIHLRDIDRDYDALNRGRRAFFEARGIASPPASTGIGGAPASARHDLCLGFYAVRAEPPPARAVMTSPTLNEAPAYGSDFVRGLRVEETNKTALLVSGTASIDEAGATAHPGDFDAQADRMLRNVAALLEGQGATFRDVVSAITYVKRPADAERLRARLREAGYEGFPNVLVKADVCRPDLLCETEALAVLPARGEGRSPA